MDWKSLLNSDTRLKYLLVPADYSQREFENQLISKQQSIGDLKVIKDKLQDSLDLLNTNLSQSIHANLSILMRSVEYVLKSFENMLVESQSYKDISKMIDMFFLIINF